MTDPAPSRTYFENSQPILRVEDMKAAIAFYVDKLGFQNASWGTEDFTSVNRDRAGIYLCRGGQGRGGAWVWVGVEDATRLHDELVARGVAIRMPLTNFKLGARVSRRRSGWECAPLRFGPSCRRYAQRSASIGAQGLKPLFGHP